MHACAKLRFFNNFFNFASHFHITIEKNCLQSIWGIVRFNRLFTVFIRRKQFWWSNLVGKLVVRYINSINQSHWNVFCLRCDELWYEFDPPTLVWVVLMNCAEIENEFSKILSQLNGMSKLCSWSIDHFSAVHQSNAIEWYCHFWATEISVAANKMFAFCFVR